VADTGKGKAQTDIADKAANIVGKTLLFGGTNHKRMKKLIQEDIKNGTNNAEEFENSLRDKETIRLGGTARPAAAPPAAAPPAAARPAAAPREGDTGTSNSGKPVVFEDGNWYFTK
jgi:hypothetical protein